MVIIASEAFIIDEGLIFGKQKLVLYIHSVFLCCVHAY